MKILIVEDDSVSSLLLQKVLTEFGPSDVAADGNQAFAALDAAWNTGAPYDLVCLDIMLPDIDGQEILKRIRKSEAGRGILGLDGVTIVMITALGDNRSILEAFRSQCEGYIVKPIRKDKVIAQIKALQL